MNTMEGAENLYSRRDDDQMERDDAADTHHSSSHRSSSHRKSKKKKKSSKRLEESEDDPREQQQERRHSSSSRKSDEENKKHKKKSRHHSDSGNMSAESPDEEHRSSRSKKRSDGERKSSRKSNRNSDDERKSSSRKSHSDTDIDDHNHDDDDDRKPAADPDYRSSRKSKRHEDDDDRKPKSKPHKTEEPAASASAGRSSSSAGGSTLGADLENQMAAKRRPTGPSPTRPGAVSSSENVASATASNLSQFEQDVQGKNRARRSAKPASTPGVVRESTGGRSSTSASATAALTRLEEDAIAKSRAARTSSGAVAATGGNQYGKASGRSSRASASRSSAAAAAAGAALYGKTTGLDAPQPASASQVASLRAVEEDLAAKTRSIEPGGRNRSGRRSNTAAAAVAGVATVGGAVGVAAVATSGPSSEPSTDAALSQLENDVMAKPRRSSLQDDFIEPLREPLALNASNEPVEDNDIMDSFAVREPIVSQDAVNGGQLNADNGTSGEAGVPGETAEIYPGVDFASQEFANEGAVEAFVADNVVDAMGVAVVMSEEEENQLERRKYKKYLIIAFCCMVLIAVAIVVPVVVVVGNVEPAAPSMEPLSAPSMVPSSAPTSSRFDATVEFLTPFSGEEALQDRSSPQYQAAQWVSDEDPLAFPLDNPRFLQRYFLAVFYFATNGDEWLHCGRLDPICGVDPDEDSWLSESNECIWLGNRCLDDLNVDRIFFGECEIRASLRVLRLMCEL